MGLLLWWLGILVSANGLIPQVLRGLREKRMKLSPMLLVVAADLSGTMVEEAVEGVVGLQAVAIGQLKNCNNNFNIFK